ncbi:MAG: ImmA/IrrE family metallo-endopeptidase [Chloroflexi bacterium]|nr:ImmA/IrrE family metallo-endopeptidase [Chloroflexota bacterium]
MAGRPRLPARHRTAAREREANAFAAAITMPADWLARELDESQDFDALARRFKVSRSALTLRLEELGLASRLAPRC